MADLSKIQEVFGEVLPEVHIFFATTANTELPSYQTVRKHLGKTTVHTNRKIWLWFKQDYKDNAPPIIPPVESISFGSFNTNPEVGVSQDIPYIITPESSYTEYTRTFESSDPTVLEFVRDNVEAKTVTITALKEGTADLTATVDDKSVKVTFTVKAVESPV